MAARKRHTASLDFMRQWLAYERGLGGWPDFDGQMVERLVKRGWLRWVRSQAHHMWTFRIIMQRRNHLESTKKGRRAVYVADRHATPVLRRHNLSGASWSMKGTIEHDARALRRLAEQSRAVRDLHGKR